MRHVCGCAVREMCPCSLAAEARRDKQLPSVPLVCNNPAACLLSAPSCLLQFIAMTAALTLLTMPLAAGTARYGLANAYFWIVR